MILLSKDIRDSLIIRYAVIKRMMFSDRKSKIFLKRLEIETHILFNIYDVFRRSF